LGFSVHPPYRTVRYGKANLSRPNPKRVTGIVQKKKKKKKKKGGEKALQK